MNGPEAYVKAMDCFAQSEMLNLANEQAARQASLLIERGQGYAMLALAAATALGAELPGRDYADWARVVSHDRHILAHAEKHHPVSGE
ncbi:hypothetical protein [Streptomyces griseoaurantiacus]|uniref:hypothetical protein n=1 Tax=Streptomyces griseoaurantiacus TaxID=68213 RepID=UPI0036AC7F58